MRDGTTTRTQTSSGARQPAARVGCGGKVEAPWPRPRGSLLRRVWLLRLRLRLGLRGPLLDLVLVGLDEVPQEALEVLRVDRVHLGPHAGGRPLHGEDLRATRQGVGAEGVDSARIEPGYAARVGRAGWQYAMEVTWE